MSFSFRGSGSIASSWHDVASRLRAAGHSVHTLTLRGLESRNADRVAGS